MTLDVGSIVVEGFDVFSSNAFPTIVQTRWEETLPTIEFASPVVAGSLIVVLLASEGPLTITNTIVDGIPNRTPYWQAIDSAVTTQIWPAEGGERFFQFEVNTSQRWSIFAMEISGEAHIPPYVITTRSDVLSSPPPNPATPEWEALDVGIAIATIVTDNAAAVSQGPADGDWTNLAGASRPSYSYGHFVRFIADAGTQAPEEWAGSFPPITAFLTEVLPLYAPGLRVGPARTYSSAPAGQVLTPGYTEMPAPGEPFEPEINPLPPDPDPITLPLPPWLPREGPYRPPD